MVSIIEKDIWACPYCNKEYDRYEDALECVQECANIDYPKESKNSIFACDYCKKQYSDEGEAEECEEDHAENQDEFFSKVKLKQAGEHPSQRRLGGSSKESSGKVEVEK